MLDREIKTFIENADKDEIEMWFFSDRRINDFISLVEKDFAWFTPNEIDKSLELDIFRQLNLNIDRRRFFKQLVPIVIRKLQAKQHLLKDSGKDKKWLISELERFQKDILIERERDEEVNQTEETIAYFYTKWTKVDKNSTSYNQALTGIIIPLDFTEKKKVIESKLSHNTYLSKEQYTIDFRAIEKDKTSDSINNALDKLFSTYNYWESYLYLLTGFISLVQSQDYQISSEVILKWLSEFLAKRFPQFLEEASVLEKRDSSVLDNPDYWRIRNLLQLFTLSSKIEKETWKQKLIVWTFSPWGSYGPVYLWQLYKQYTDEKKTWKEILPDIYIWSSAWSLYPTLFLLWKKALETNPEWLQKIIPDWAEVDGFKSLISLIPKDITPSDSMLWSWWELVGNFFLKFRELVKVIYPDKDLDFDNLSFEDLDLPFIAVSSYEYENNKYVPGLFTGKDNIKKSILTSSNPKQKFLWIDLNVLSYDNEIYWKKWNDGSHSLSNPFEIGYLLNKSLVRKYESIYRWESDISRFSSSKGKYEELSPFSWTDLKAITQINSFDLDAAVVLIIIWYCWELEIHNLYDILIAIGNSSASEKKKVIYRDKLVSFLLKKEFSFHEWEDNSLKIDKALKLLEEWFLTKEETDEYIQNLAWYEENSIKKFIGYIDSMDIKGAIWEVINDISNKYEEFSMIFEWFKVSSIPLRSIERFKSYYSSFKRLSQKLYSFNIHKKNESQKVS